MTTFGMISYVREEAPYPMGRHRFCIWRVGHSKRPWTTPFRLPHFPHTIPCIFKNTFPEEQPGRTRRRYRLDLNSLIPQHTMCRPIKFLILRILYYFSTRYRRRNWNRKRRWRQQHFNTTSSARKSPARKPFRHAKKNNRHISLKNNPVWKRLH